MSFWTLRIWLGSWFFNAGYVGALLLFALVLPFSQWLAYMPRYRVVTSWSRFIIWWLDKTCGLRCRIEGTEHIPPPTQPVIVLSRHESAWETIFFPVYFPPQVWVVKKELLRIPLFGWGLRQLGVIAIDREKRTVALKHLTVQGKRALDAGRWVIIFPEGTRLPPGTTGKFNVGGAMLAEYSQTPVLPVWHNAGSYWPRNAWLKKPGEITLRCGPLITPEGKSASEINKIAQAWIDNQT